MILLLITNLLYAIGYPLSQVALATSQPLFLIALRMLLGGGILLGYHLVTKRTIKLSKNVLWPLGLSGILTAYLSNIWSYWGLATVTATRAALIDNLSPLMSAFMEWIIFKDQFSALEWIGIIIATLATMPAVASPFVHSELMQTVWWNLSWGDFIIILSNLAGVYGFICIRKIATADDYQPILANGVSMLVGGSCALAHSLLTENWTPVPAQDMFSVAVHVCLMMLIYNFAVDNLYNYLAREYSVTTLMLSGFTVPLFTAVLDWFMFGFTVSSVFWVSSLVVCVGLLCCAKKRHSFKTT